jgi:hypothetical protein
MSSRPLEPLQPLSEPLPHRDALEYTEAQLLAEHDFEEPLVAGGVRCHGGFIKGEYVSPRTLVREPAIAAWKTRLADEGQPLIQLPARYIPPHYPNVAQAKLLLLEGIREPIVRALTTISIVEGFGALVRDLPLPDLGTAVAEDIGGTALAHLRSGLFEAHARDEAGHRDQGGHKQMWEAARDLGLDRPEIPQDVLMRMMMGRGGSRPEPLFPDLAPKMEALVSAMANVMVVEIFAADVFDWGQRLLGDPEVSAKPEAAAEMVGYIRADESPHVEYLRTALSEIRARTLLTSEGKPVAGSEVVDAIFARQLTGIASSRPREARDRVRQELRDAVEEGTRLSTDFMRRFDDLDSGWTFPEDDEPVDLITA